MDAKFKVGDKVKAAEGVWKSSAIWYGKTGTITDVEEVGGELDYTVVWEDVPAGKWGDNETPMAENQLILA